MKRIGIILLLFCSGCGTITFDDNSKEVLVAYLARQNAVNENIRHQAEINEAVKAVQIQAVRGGFAYWDVDYTGKVEFKWIGQKRK